MPNKTSHIEKATITAVILAGGRGSRMGGVNKGLLPLHGRAMIGHIIDRVRPQVGALVISANQELDAYRNFGYEVITDVLANSYGPLAGIYSAMTVIHTDWLACVPCDMPYIPTDLIARLAFGETSQLARVAHDGIRQQSACCLLHVNLREPLKRFLLSDQHAVHRFLSEQHALQVDFSDVPAAFININTNEELINLG